MAKKWKGLSGESIGEALKMPLEELYRYIDFYEIEKKVENAQP